MQKKLRSFLQLNRISFRGPSQRKPCLSTDGLDGCDVDWDSHELGGETLWPAGSDETGGE